jgi:hypothetical protein
MTRRAVVIAFVVAELWQLFFGAFSSLQLGAPGVGNRASWVPNVLVAEAFSLLPLGFALAFWGAPVGRLFATVCAAASLIVAVVVAITLSSPQSSFLFAIPLLAVPGLVLLASALRIRRAEPGA